MFNYNILVIQRQKEKEKVMSLKNGARLAKIRKTLQISKVDLSGCCNYIDTFKENLRISQPIKPKIAISNNNSTGNLLKNIKPEVPHPKKIIISYKKEKNKVNISPKIEKEKLKIMSLKPHFKVDSIEIPIIYKNIVTPNDHNIHSRNIKFKNCCESTENIDLKKKQNDETVPNSPPTATKNKRKAPFQINNIKLLYNNLKFQRSISPELKVVSPKIKLPVLKMRKSKMILSDIETIILEQLKPFCSLNPLIQKTIRKNTSVVYYYRISKHYREQFKEYFKHRINWQHIQILPKNEENNNETNENLQIINLKWKFSSKKIDYKKIKYDQKTKNENLQVVNIFERFEEIGNKNLFFLNLLSYCNDNNINVFDIVPMTVIINNGKGLKTSLEQFKEMMDIFSSIKKEPSQSNEKGTFIGKLYSDIFRKDNQKNKKDFNNVYVYVPYSFLSNQNYWIIKPNNLYQGKCITISNDINSIGKMIHNLFICGSLMDKKLKPLPLITGDNTTSPLSKPKKNNTRHIPDSIVIQKYLDRPLLYNKRKFDIRCYVLIDFEFNLFYCREGHLKASSKEYDINNPDLFIHITNYSFQKKCEGFSKYEYGNEISYQTFRNFLKSTNQDTNLFDECIKTMIQMIKISMLSVGSKKLLKSKNVLCFQIFGYDFIIDENFKPWILEINDNPGLSISSPVIAKLIPRMFDDAMRLTIDKIFNTVYSNEVIDSNTNSYKSKYPLDGYNENENVFEFLGNIKND